MFLNTFENYIFKFKLILTDFKKGVDNQGLFFISPPIIYFNNKLYEPQKWSQRNFKKKSTSSSEIIAYEFILKLGNFFRS